MRAKLLVLLVSAHGVIAATWGVGLYFQAAVASQVPFRVLRLPNVPANLYGPRVSKDLAAGYGSPLGLMHVATDGSLRQHDHGGMWYVQGPGIGCPGPYCG